jgi:bifunctional DNA-binding transcriptional regulator/antitoxin component of YhaV-PrlF toxin-antitoxin module
MTSSESFVAYVQVLRRVAIPIEVYEAMQLKEGDKVRVVMEKIVVPKQKTEGT